MDKNIQNIVDELIQLEPSLSKHRGELEKVVGQILKAQPEVKMDEYFKEGLKRKILAKLALGNESNKQLKWSEKFMISKFNIGMAVITLVAVTTSAVLYDKAYGPIRPFTSEIEIGKSGVIKDLGLNGFGDLKLTEGGGGGMDSAREVAAPKQQDAKMSAGSGGGADASIMPYKVYKFQYVGDEFTIDEPQVVVYRTARNSYSGQAARLLSGFRLSDYGIKDFQNPRVDSLMITDDRDQGYSVYIDFVNGSVNINQDYARWNTIEKQCSWEQECIKRRTGGSVPSNSEIINIAESFLADQGINKSGFGSPVVSVQQMRMFESARSVDPAFVSPIVSVVYPRIIEGRETKDESGNPSGMYVNVNIWDRAVSNVSDIGILNFEKASYIAETDTARIRKLAESGSYYGYEAPNDPNAQVETLKLGTPVRGLVRTWTSDNNGNGSQVYVEALMFPIETAKDNEYYSDFVTIPLAKDVLDKAQQQTAIPLSE